MSSLHTLKRTSARSKKRVGRGQSSGKGKQSGRGTKGQNSRAGRKKRPEMRDIIKKLPKRRGYGKNRARTVDPSRANAVAISLTRIDKLFDSGAEVTPKALFELGVIGRTDRTVKLVGGETSKKFIIKGATASASAKATIEKAGGSIQ